MTRRFLPIFHLLLAIGLLTTCGCDRLYGMLHKPGGEEREILGTFQFNEYNPRVEQLQKILRAFGYVSGRPDGKFGANTREAIAKFQADEKLPVTRFVDKVTWAKMQEYLNSGLFQGTDLDGRAVQAALKNAGFFEGKVDGRIGKQTHQAVKAFQSSRGVTADGFIGIRTIRELIKFIKE